MIKIYTNFVLHQSPSQPKIPKDMQWKASLLAPLFALDLNDSIVTVWKIIFAIFSNFTHKCVRDEVLPSTTENVAITDEIAP